jgi:hypothetical protein
VVGDDVHSAGLERSEHRLVHLSAVDAHVAEIVIVEHQCHEIDAVRSDRGRKRILELLHDGDDVSGRRVLRALGETHRRRRRGGRRLRRARRAPGRPEWRRLRVLQEAWVRGPDRAARFDRTRDRSDRLRGR